MSNSLQELKIRLSLAEVAIRVLEDADDPRAPEALEYYRKQRAEIQSQIDALEPPAPKDIVIGLKPGRLWAKSSQKED